jgi:hypothetical protein
VLSAPLPALLLLLLLQVGVPRPQPQEAWQRVVRAGGLRQRAVTPALTITGLVRLDEAATTTPTAPRATSRPCRCSGGSCTNSIRSICSIIIILAAAIL